LMSAAGTSDYIMQHVSLTQNQDFAF